MLGPLAGCWPSQFVTVSAHVLLVTPAPTSLTIDFQMITVFSQGHLTHKAPALRQLVMLQCIVETQLEFYRHHSTDVLWWVLHIGPTTEMGQLIFILLFPTSRPNTDEADCIFSLFTEEHKELPYSPVWPIMLLKFNLRATGVFCSWLQL